MSRPFLSFRASRPSPVADGLVRTPPAQRARRLVATLNPLDGAPPPLPRRRRKRGESLAVGDEASPTQERALRNFWWDGFFAESSETVWLQYFALYALALGAGVGLIGMLAAVGNLFAALSMFPGALLAERTRRYKFIVVFSAGGLGRAVFLLLALIPWIATGSTALGIVIAVAALRGFLDALAMPAWNAFAGEFVPPHLRGRYVASRNFARQLAVLLIAPFVGLLIALTGLAGWQAVWLLAFALGMSATYFYARIPSVTPPQAAPLPAQPAPSPSALRDKRLLAFVATTGFFQLSVMIAAPFFSVYLVRELGASMFWVGLIAAMMPVGGMIAKPYLGRALDRVGPKRMLVTSGLLFPLVAWGWLLATEPWQLIFVNLLSGALWAANLLGTFNLILAIAPADRRPTYAGMQQAGLFLAAFAGPLIGGALISVLGFPAVIFLSGAGRFVGAAALARTVSTEDEQATAPPEPRLEPAAAA